MTAIGIEAFLIWLIVGMLAGYIVSELLPSAELGLEGNILIGMIGAVVCGYLFLNVMLFPLAALAWHVFSAALGAVSLLSLARYLRWRI